MPLPHPIPVFCRLAPLLLACILGASRPAVAQDTTKKPGSPAVLEQITRPMTRNPPKIDDAAPPRDKSKADIAAEVEGRPITMADVRDAIQALPPAVARLPLEVLYDKVLRQLIQQQALVVRAMSVGLEDDPDVRRRIRNLTDGVLADAFVRREAANAATEHKLLELYEREVAGKPGPEEVHARVIFTDTERAASEQIAALRGGADFASLARKFSKDVTASLGGDLGFVARAHLTPEIGAVAFSLALGEYSAFPIFSNGQWVVVKVEGRRAGPTPNFYAVRDELLRTLLHDGAVGAVNSAISGLTIREYDLSGNEVAAGIATRP